MKFAILTFGFNFISFEAAFLLGVNIMPPYDEIVDEHEKEETSLMQYIQYNFQQGLDTLFDGIPSGHIKGNKVNFGEDDSDEVIKQKIVSFLKQDDYILGIALDSKPYIINIGEIPDTDEELDEYIYKLRENEDSIIASLKVSDELQQKLQENNAQ
jgi:hypothetical protein